MSIAICRASTPIARRGFLKISAATAALIAGSTIGARLTRAASPIDLKIGPARVPLVGKGYPETLVWAFNDSVPGPVISAVQGERLEIKVKNELGEPTTVHWHGLRVPVGMDGVPYTSASRRSSLARHSPTRSIWPDAGTYWYHPHINSSEQVGRGLYGALVVEEAAAAGGRPRVALGAG